MAELRNILLVFALSFVLCISTDAKKNRECEVECVRIENLQKQGHTLDHKVLNVDVGDCQTILTNTTTSGACDTDIIEQEEICLKRCIPRSRKMTIVSKSDGPIEVPVIKGCYPTMHHCLTTCERRPNYIYYFPDSKYQTRIDIGKCVGSCNVTSNRCKAVKKRTVAIEGPNGAITVNVTDSCDCVNPGCYRVDYFMSFWNYYDNATQREEKAVNVGKCAGGCPGVLLPETCLPNPESCLLRVPGMQATCAPEQTGSVSYTNEENEVISVPTITSCACGSG